MKMYFLYLIYNALQLQFDFSFDLNDGLLYL